MEKNEDTIDFETQSGDKVKLSVLEQTMLGGINYLLVTDSEHEEGEFFILKEDLKDKEAGGEYAVYALVEDDKELRIILPVFEELLEDIDLEV